MTRDELLRLDDENLLRECRVERMRGTGPGGQKRNVTESAVRIAHAESGVSAFSDTTRSQHRNRSEALARLRHELAVRIRREPTGNPSLKAAPGRRTPAYSIWIAEILDRMAANDYRLADTAHALQTTTSQLVKLLADDLTAWECVNREREKRRMGRLRPPK